MTILLLQKHFPAHANLNVPRQPKQLSFTQNSESGMWMDIIFHCHAQVLLKKVSFQLVCVLRSVFSYWHIS